MTTPQYLYWSSVGLTALTVLLVSNRILFGEYVYQNPSMSDMSDMSDEGMTYTDNHTMVGKLSWLLQLSVLCMIIANALMFAAIYSTPKIASSFMVSYDLVISVYALMILLLFFRDRNVWFATYVLLLIVEVGLVYTYWDSIVL